jgi:signal transduction histidine kinase
MALRELSAGPPPAGISGRGLLRLTAGLAHTVNNSLTGTIGYLELALRRLPSTSEQHNELRAALACTYRAADALRQLVAFATAPSHVHPVPVSLCDAAQAATRAAGDVACDNITVVMLGDRPAQISARLPLLSAAIEQIVRNAIEAMPSGGRLTLETEEVAGRCKLWIRDNGPGMSPEVLDHLFEPFVSTKSFGHLGLGLSLAHELVRSLDGTLVVSSCPGAGTTVLLSFPALKTSDVAAISTEKRHDGPHFSRAGRALTSDEDAGCNELHASL